MTPPIQNSKTPLPASSESFRLRNPGSYSFKLEGGFGGRDLANDQGIDHKGSYVRLGLGLRFQPGSRHSLTPRLFFEHQDLRKNLGEGIESQAKVNAFGVELDYGYALVRQWLSLHATLGVGGAFYQSEEASNGLKGTEFAKNALLFPLKARGFRVELGAQLCTWRDAFCFGLGYALDSGINPQLSVVDGNYPRLGLNPAGFKFGISVDGFRIFHNLRKTPKRETPAPIPAPAGPEKIPVNMPPAQAVPSRQPRQPIATPTQAAPRPIPAKGPTGMALFRHWETRVHYSEIDAKTWAFEAKVRRDQIKLEVKKTNPDWKVVRRLAEESMPFYQKALKLNQGIDAALIALKKAGRDIKIGSWEFRESVRVFKKLKRSADGIYLQAFLAHGYTAEAVREYNAKAAKGQTLDFPVTMPGKRRRVTAPRAAKTPAKKPAPTKASPPAQSTPGRSRIFDF